MGSCATSKALQNKNQLKHIGLIYSGTQRMIELADREKQILCLRLIYNDLASRSILCNLNIKDFRIFFHLNQVLGASLFKKFSILNQKQLTEKQFVQGVFGACDLNQANRIRFMFSVLDIDQNRGLSYHELVGLLLSSSYECLSQILKNEKFLDTLGFSEILYHLVNSKKQTQIGQNYLTLYPYMKYKKIYCKDYKQRQVNVEYGMESLNQAQLVKQSKETIIKLLKTKIDKRLFNMKLISRFASHVFQILKLDKQKDQIRLNQFKKLISSNPIMFQIYFSGFHEYLWKHEGGFPLYKSIQPQISDYCIQKIGNHCRDVYIVFMKTSIMIFECNKMKEPLGIKNLEGLQIKQIGGHLGYGFSLSHNSSTYSQSQYFFQDKAKQKQWIQMLKLFRSQNIEKRYKIKQKIGNGVYSQIHECVHKQTNLRYAVKIIKKNKQRQSNLRYLQCESEILGLLNHQNIVKIYQRYDTSKNIYLIVQLIEGDNLLEFIKFENRKNVIQEDAKCIMKQLFEAMSTMHQLGIIHRDIKFDNILMIKQNGKLIPKIIDFGSAIYKMQIPLLERQVKFTGSEPFRAPEIAKEQEYDEKSDIYSLGVIMFYMLVGRFPFDESNLKETKLQFSQFESRRLSLKAKELLRLLLSQKNKRLSAQQVLKHKWFC